MEHQVHIPENRNLFILKNIYRPDIKKICSSLFETSIHTYPYDQNISLVFVRNDLNFITTHLLVPVCQDTPQTPALK